MKKIFFLAIVLSSCVHISNTEKPITASKSYFIVSRIEPVNDTLKHLCKYHLLADSSVVLALPSPHQSYDDIIEFDLIDTTGKYKISDTLILSLKQNENSGGF